ncbi:hypothetical protein GB931_01840 [Modestobacter sp. I12A-02628]|uniref:Uncharacterized protein n=1 Tax=Goekera deserti TaxID=2497753 RepID=A0A7K3WII3_9ACTN|nr:DUF6461 domain-containing protein [Goekera deserti]MPQ96679.1 hypothetical protein [Goekera deserti]NDI47007.1 hypothetical protein [Goekera deserti]NEL56244.1 hypothetical protein [Goekera deserti]
MHRRTPDGTLAAHPWVAEVEAVTLTLVSGWDLTVLGGALGIDWSTRGLATFEEVAGQQDHARGHFLVQVDEADGWLLVVEPNGHLCARPGTVAALSAGGTAVSVSWNVNAVQQFTLARAGVVVRCFDPVAYPTGGEQEQLAEELGLPFGDPDADPRPAMLTVAERITGVRLDGYRLLGAEHRTWSATGPTPH